MVVTTIGLDAVKASALDALNNSSHIGIGTSNVGFNPSQIALLNEVFRNLLDVAERDNITGTYRFEYRLPKTKNNGETFGELGIFDSATGGEMYLREQFPTLVDKVESDEHLYVIEVTITAENI